MTLKPLVFVAILLPLDAMIYGAAPRSSRDHALWPTGDSAATRPRRRGDAAPAQRRISERTVLAPSCAGAPRKEGRGRFGTSGDIWVARACRRPGPIRPSASACCAPQVRDVCRHGPPGRRRYTPLFPGRLYVLGKETMKIPPSVTHTVFQSSDGGRHLEPSRPSQSLRERRRRARCSADRDLDLTLLGHAHRGRRHRLLRNLYRHPRL